MQKISMMIDMLKINSIDNNVNCQTCVVGDIVLKRIP